MTKLSISEAAKLKGVSTQTLRRWEASGKLIPGSHKNKKLVEELKDVASRI